MPEESGSNLNLNSVYAMIVYKLACLKQDTRHKRPLKASSQLTLLSERLRIKIFYFDN